MMGYSVISLLQIYTVECTSKRMLNIGQHLLKLWSYEHGCMV